MQNNNDAVALDTIEAHPRVTNGNYRNFAFAPPEQPKVRAPTMMAKIKNMGTSAQVFFDADSNTVRIPVGETKPVKLAITFVNRLRKMAEHEDPAKRGPLRVINESEAEFARAAPLPQPMPMETEDPEAEEPDDDDVPVQRVRVRVPSPAQAVQDYEAARDAANGADDDDEDAEAKAYVENAKRDKAKLGKRAPRQVVYPEIVSPVQLLAHLSESEEPMHHTHLAMVARRVLPEGTFREFKPNRATILRALETAVQRRRR